MLSRGLHDTLTATTQPQKKPQQLRLFAIPYHLVILTTAGRAAR